MSPVETAPTAMHIGSSDQPWVTLRDGSQLRVLQVREKEGLWIIESRFFAGLTLATHRHTGPVWGYTVSGAWKYLESDFINTAGSFLYEPAGSVHTLTCLEDDTQVWFHMYGVNLNLDADGKVEDVVDGANTLALYLKLCERQGAGTPTLID